MPPQFSPFNKPLPIPDSASEVNDEKFLLMDTESKEENLELLTKELFLNYSVKKVNEGNNGIIVFVDQDKLTPFGDIFTDALDGVAIKFLKSPKLLKVSNRTSIQREFKNQQTIYNILSKENNVGKCPQAYLECGFNIADDEKMKEAFFALGYEGEYADVMFMDFIPGKDLAHIQYQELFKLALREFKNGITHKYSRVGLYENYTDQEIDNLSYSSLQDIVSEIFFEITSPTEAKHIADGKNVKAEERNANIVDSELKRLGFTVAKEITTRMVNTVRLLENNGIFIQDCHDRNIMIKGDITDPNAEVYFIDFDRTHYSTPGVGSYDYRGPDGIQYPNPMNSIMRMIRITKAVEAAEAARKLQPTPEEFLTKEFQTLQESLKSKNENNFKLGVSKNQENNKVPAFEKSIRSALLEACQINLPLNKKLLLKEYRDSSGNRITFGTRDGHISEDENLLRAVFGLMFSLKKEGKINEAQVDMLVDKIYSCPDFVEAIEIKYTRVRKVDKDQIKSIIKNAV